MGPFWAPKWCRDVARKRSPKRTPSGSRFGAKFGPKRLADHLKNVDFVLVFIRFIENHRSEPAGRDGGGKGAKMDPKSVHFGARERPLWGPDSVPSPRPVSGPIWVAIWAVWGSILGAFWGPIWAPFRCRFSVRFSVAVWGAPGAIWGPSPGFSDPGRCSEFSLGDPCGGLKR